MLDHEHILHRATLMELFSLRPGAGIQCKPLFNIEIYIEG